MKPSFTPCFFSNTSLYCAAQLHHRAHVDLVEGRQHGGGVLRVLQAARDGLAQPGHRTRSSRARVVGAARARAAAPGAGGRRRGAAAPARDGGEHVALGDAAVLAGAGDARRRRRRSRRRCGRRRGRWRVGAARPCAGVGAGGGLRRPRRWLARLGASAAAARPAAAAPAPPAVDARRAARRRRPSRRPWRRCRRARRRPARCTSSVTLSVSSSTSGSSAFTASPAFLNHLPMVASVTDSPRVGTRISVAMIVTAPRSGGPQCRDGRERRRAASGRERFVEEGLQLRADAWTSGPSRSRPRPGGRRSAARLTLHAGLARAPIRDRARRRSRRPCSWALPGTRPRRRS